MSDPQPHNEPKRLGFVMLLAAWLLALAVLAVLFGDRLDEQRNPNQSVNSLVRQGATEVTLLRNRLGHYVVTGTINGHDVEFFVDTGASDVSIPSGLADRVGLKRGAPLVYQTANGPIQAYQTVLGFVSIGDIRVDNVRASINPRVGGDQVLLGMSFLKQLEFSHKDGQLTLRQP